MAKRQIRGKRGKQLYLNKIFNRGMLHTSSEMKPGYVKTLSNYNITPTGDAATPRRPYAIVGFENDIELNKYTYPIKFQQAVGEQHYVEFLNTVDREQFLKENIGDTVHYDEPNELHELGVKMYSRSDNALNQLDYSNVIGEDGSYSPPKITLTGHVDLITDTTNIEDIEVAGVSTGALLIADNEHVHGALNRSSIADPEQDQKRLVINDIENIRVIDGDTVEYKKVSYRLLGYDSPEINEEWGEYAYRSLEIIISQAEKIVLLEDLEARKPDNHGRPLRWIFIVYEGVSFLINEIMVMIGVGRVKFQYGNYKYNQELINAEKYARAYELKLWSHTETDPYYTYVKNGISITGLPEGIGSNNVYIEALTLKGSKFITHNLKNEIDMVEFVYLDYLDAIAFIGRVVDNRGVQPKVLYKGVLILKCDIKHEKPVFFLEMAENEGEGYIPGITESVGSGYNLYNSELLNLNNTKEPYYPMSILGIVPVTSDYNEEIVIRATPGSNIRLKGIINEGFLPTSSVSTSNIEFEIIMTIKRTTEVTTTHVEYPDQTEIYEHEEEFDFVFSNNYMNTTNKFLTDNDIIEKIVPEKQQDEETYYRSIFKRYDYKISTILKEPIKTKPTVIEKEYVSEIRELVIVKDVIELFIDTQIHEQYITININTNLSNLLKGFDSEGELTVDKERERVVLSRWEKSISDDRWETIDEYENYVLEGSTLVPKETESGPIPNYINYTVEENKPVSIRYSLINAILLEEGVYLYNSFQNLSHVLPQLIVGNEWKTLSQKELKTNVNIRNATRIGVFNRQLFLYGDVGSNSIQFSMFEKHWYFPFPFFNIGIDENIIHVHNHKDGLIIFGQYNIYMLLGGASALELQLFKIYENLSIQPTDIDTVVSLGNNVMFFNKQMGYVLVPNKYTGNPEDIEAYKLTENISNLLVDPDMFIKQRFNIDINDSPFHSIVAKYNIFVEDNVINIAISYVATQYDEKINFVVIYRYNQTFRYWSLYDIKMFDRIVKSYICEPQLGEQFVVEKDGKSYLSTIIDNDLPDNFIEQTADVGLDGVYKIETFVDSGYLSVDTMNEKRFKDLLIEFNNIGGANINLFCDFYIDGKPFMVSRPDAIELNTGRLEPKRLPGAKRLDGNPGYTLGKDLLGTIKRIRVRFPVWGKGRMPSFTLSMDADDIYELINFSIIYKEKSIERR